MFPLKNSTFCFCTNSENKRGNCCVGRWAWRRSRTPQGFLWLSPPHLPWPAWQPEMPCRAQAAHGWGVDLKARLVPHSGLTPWQGVGGSGEPSPGHPAAPSGSDAVVLGMAVAPGLCLHHCREALSSSPHIWASLPLSRWLCSFCAVVSTCSRGYKAPAHPDPAAVHGGGRFMCPGRERPSPFPTPQCRLLSCTWNGYFFCVRVFPFLSWLDNVCLYSNK